MIGGIRSGMSYCGAANLKNYMTMLSLSKCQVLRLQKKLHPHDVQITNEA